MKPHEFLVNGKPHRIEVLQKNGDAFLVKANEKPAQIKIKNTNQGDISLIEIDGEDYQIKMDRTHGNILHVRVGGKVFEVQRKLQACPITGDFAVKREATTTIVKKPLVGSLVDAVTAPISGRIVSVRAKTGQRIVRGECICVLEAMKMQNEVCALKAGVVKEIRVSAGTIVNKGDVLAIID